MPIPSSASFAKVSLDVVGACVTHPYLTAVIAEGEVPLA